jgi:hypothetical protein
VASTLELHRNGAVGLIDWLDAALETQCAMGGAPEKGEAAALVHICPCMALV